MPSIRTVSPTVEPVTLAEAKTHLRITSTDDDTWITAAITAAREDAEAMTRRALITQTWALALDEFPDAIQLSPARVLGISSVTYYDEDGVQQTLAGTSYDLDNYSEPAWLVPAAGYSWPSTLEKVNCVIVTYTCGYGASAASVPEPYKMWIKMRVAAMNENREQLAAGDAPEAVTALDGLLDRFRVMVAA